MVRVAGAGADGDPDAGTDPHGAGAGLDRRAEHAEQAVCQRPDPRLIGDVRTEDHELVAPQAGHRVTGSDSGSQPASQDPQNGVARGVALPVVHRLEVVQVDEDHRRPSHPGLVAAAGDGLPEPVEQQDPVGDAGERVVERSVAELSLLVRQVLLHHLALLVVLRGRFHQVAVTGLLDPGTELGQQLSGPAVRRHLLLQHAPHGVPPGEIGQNDPAEGSCDPGNAATDTSQVGQLPLGRLRPGGDPPADELHPLPAVALLVEQDTSLFVTGHERAAAGGGHLDGPHDLVLTGQQRLRDPPAPHRCGIGQHVATTNRRPLRSAGGRVRPASSCPAVAVCRRPHGRSHTVSPPEPEPEHRAPRTAHRSSRTSPHPVRPRQTPSSRKRAAAATARPTGRLRRGHGAPRRQRRPEPLPPRRSTRPVHDHHRCPRPPGARPTTGGLRSVSPDG